MKFYSGFITLLVLAAIPQPSWGWGDQGHSITALVAQKILKNDSSDEAKTALTAITAILIDTTMEKGATWPDWVKTQARACKNAPYNTPDVCAAYKGTPDWHFINATGPKYQPPAAGSRQYEQAEMVMIVHLLSHLLKGENDPSLAPIASFEKWKSACMGLPDHHCKKEALEFLIHLVGDMHQPLHSGFICDVGGNSQFITFFGEDQESKKDTPWCDGPKEPATCRNHELQAAWDTSLLLHQSESNAINYVSNDDYSSRLISLMKKSNARASVDSTHCVTTAPDLAININDSSFPSSWVEESLCYMPQVYSFPDDKVAKSAGPHRKIAQESGIPNLCLATRKQGEGRNTAFQAFPVGPAYAQANMRTINERLYWGGSRLASLLKLIYGQGDKSNKFD